MLALAREMSKMPGYNADRGNMSHVDVLRLFPRDFELEKRGDHARAAVLVRMRDVGARGELAR